MRNDLLHNAHEMGFIFEMDAGLFELSEALHKAFLVCVDQDVVDGRILEQWLDRSKACHLVDDFLRESLQLSLIEGEPLCADIFAEIGTNLADQVLARKLFQGYEIELVNDPLVQFKLLVEQGRPLCNQLAIDVLFCSRGGFTRDDFRDRLRPRSRRNIGEKAHFLLMLREFCIPLVLVYKALALVSPKSAVWLTAQCPIRDPAAC